MKYLGVILAVGITAVIVLTIGIFNFVMAADVQSAGDPASLPEADAPLPETAAAADTGAIEAAFAARESLLLSQIEDLDGELAGRQSDYEQQVEDLQAVITAGEEQLSLLQDQESAVQEQIEQLRLAQTERTATYESQRQQAYYQYELSIQQLQSQLDEANAKLFEANARLGQ